MTTTHNHWKLLDKVETGLIMIRIDHLINNDYVCNPLLLDLVIDFDDEPGIDSAARDSDQTNSLDVSHMRWSMFAGVSF